MFVEQLFRITDSVELTASLRHVYFAISLFKPPRKMGSSATGLLWRLERSGSCARCQSSINSTPCQAFSGWALPRCMTSSTCLERASSLEAQTGETVLGCISIRERRFPDHHDSILHWQWPLFACSPLLLPAYLAQVCTVLGNTCVNTLYTLLLQQTMLSSTLQSSFSSRSVEHCTPGLLVTSCHGSNLTMRLDLVCRCRDRSGCCTVRGRDGPRHHH